MDGLTALQSEQLLDFVAAKKPPEPFSPDQIGGGKKRPAASELVGVEAFLVAVQPERVESRYEGTARLCCCTAQ